MICRFCGKTVRENALYCSFCGKKIGKSVEEKSLMYKKITVLMIVAIVGVVLFLVFALSPKSAKCDSCGERYSEDSDDYKYIATYGVCSDCYSYVWEDFWF